MTLAIRDEGTLLLTMGIRCLHLATRINANSDVFFFLENGQENDPLPLITSQSQELE